VAGKCRQSTPKSWQVERVVYGSRIGSAVARRAPQTPEEQRDRQVGTRCDQQMGGRARSTPGLLHHSDRGSQHASHDYLARLQVAQVQVSMSCTGNCYDDALMESFWVALQTKLVEDQPARFVRCCASRQLPLQPGLLLALCAVSGRALGRTTRATVGSIWFLKCKVSAKEGENESWC